jgi:quinoprotein relay system zinc metallohydrolase 2
MIGRRAAAACGAAIIALLAPGFARCEAAFAVAQVAPGVFVHLGKPLPLDAPGHDDIANIGFIVGKRCVAVIDTGGSVRIGRELRAAVRKHTALPVCYVINTHVHVDHVLGNAAFRDDGPSYVGHALLGEALSRSRDFFLKNYAADLEPPASAQQIIAPDRTVPLDSDLQLDLGARRLTLHAWPRAHTDCDLTVYDATSATLWTGDLLFVQRTPVVDGSAKGWLATLEVLGKLPATHVVPGHGPVGTRLSDAIAPEQRYLQGLVDGVRTELARGEPLQQALKDIQPADSSGWLLWDVTHPRNVARVYQELEWE